MDKKKKKLKTTTTLALPVIVTPNEDFVLEIVS